MNFGPLYLEDDRGTEVRTGAIELATRGWRVFPVFEPLEGRCSCNKSSCPSPGKHPRVRSWLEQATSDLATIDDWWRRWPEANVGVVTGEGLVVVDIDGPEGEREAAALELPDTVEASTGRGRHLYYSGDARCQVGLRPGIDVRGAGGYVVAPPSRHAAGGSYSWLRELADQPVAELPDLPARTTQSRTHTLPGTGESCAQEYRNGQRNIRLFQDGCLMASIGMSESEIAAALLVRRNERCDRSCGPPVEDDEVLQIAANAARNGGVWLDDLTLLALDIQPPTALKVYLAIRDHANHQGVAIVGLQELAYYSGLSRSTVTSVAIPALVRAGLIDKQTPDPRQRRGGGGRLANEYTLLDPLQDLNDKELPK